MRLAVGDMKEHNDYFEAAELALAENLPAEAKNILDKAAAAHVLAGARDQRLVNLTNTKLSQDGAQQAQLRQQADANPHDGNADVKLAESLWSYGKYADAEQFARRGIKEGNLQDPDTAKIVLGHILLSAGHRGRRPDIRQRREGQQTRVRRPLVVADGTGRSWRVAIASCLWGRDNGPAQTPGPG